MSGKSRTIDREDLTAYERWELPVVGSSQASSRSVTAQKQVKLPTAEEAEKIRKAAYQSGFEEGKQRGHKEGLAKGLEKGFAEGQKQGMEQGLKDGFAEGKVRVDAALGQLTQLISNMANPLAESQELVEQAVLNSVLAISRAVVMRELETTPAQINLVIDTALSHLSKVHHESISLRVNAGDLEYAQQALANSDSNIKIEVDPNMLPGGCLVESDKQVIDYTLEKRFQKTVQGLLANVVSSADANHPSEGPDYMEEQADLHRSVMEEDVPSVEIELEPAQTGPSEQAEALDNTSQPDEQAELPRAEESTPGNEDSLDNSSDSDLEEDDDSPF